MYLIDLSNRQNTIFENHFGKVGFYGGEKKILKKGFSRKHISFIFLFFWKMRIFMKGIYWVSFQGKPKFEILFGKGKFHGYFGGGKNEVYFQGDEKFHGLLENECQF